VRIQGASSELAGAIGGIDVGQLAPLEGAAPYGRPALQNPVIIAKITTDQAYRALFDYAFPIVDPLQSPMGSNVLVQFRTPRKTTASGRIHLASETRDTEKWNTQVGLVLAVGPVSFKRRDTLAPWPEGAWCRPGDFVRTPLHGGDKWEIAVPGRQGDENALFAFYRDLDLLGLVTGDPLMVKAYVI
jgi:co-chaperonin GroES (HSP10)